MSQMRLVYADNNSYWFDACRFIGGFQASPAVKQNTKYHIKIRYKAQGISGPRDATYPGYGLVAKVQNPHDGNWHTNCYNGGDPQNGVKVTGYGQDLSDWTYLEGEWNSGSANILPIFYLALENANDLTATVNGQPWNWHPQVDIDTVSISEDLGNGQYGPNVVTKPSMEQLSYYMERNAYSFDKVLDLAKQNGVYLKLVVMEKNEQIENEIGYDGKAASFDNNNFYGNYRTMTAVRWYQQAWWRYLQARWGYSPNIFSFEAVNEAAPGYTNHYGQVDEMGKYLHCGVFGVSVLPYDGQKCNLVQPDAHMVSTSFTYGFERNLFASNKYPNIDYADIHQYIAKDSDLMHFQDTALSTYDLGQAYGALESGSGKPIIRGETGLINQSANTNSMTDVSSDTQGIWLHNLIWGGINSTGLIENYWYAKDQIYKTVDLRGQYKNYYTFIKDIPLNNGKYVDASAVVSNPKIRAWGQKDLTNQRIHLWIANTDHVWTNTEPIAPVNGTVTIAGLSPSSLFNVEWWDTYKGAAIDTQAVSTNSNGEITLTISNLSTDTAVRITPQTISTGSTPTNTPTVTPTNATITPTAASTIVFTDTPTDVPTNTPTIALTNIIVNTPTTVPSSTATSISTGVSSNTAVPTYTYTASPTNIPTATAIVVSTPTKIDTATVAPSYTSTVLPIDTKTPEPTATIATQTQTPKPSSTATKVEATSKSQILVLTPISITTQFGTTKGAVDSLAKLDQNESNDDSSKYIAFQPKRNLYVGYVSFTLPNNIPASIASKLLLQVNIKTSSSVSSQTWSIYNWSKRKWIRVGVARTIKRNNHWRTLKFDIQAPKQYISPKNEIRIQLRSINSRGDVKIDYEVIQVVYGSHSTNDDGKGAPSELIHVQDTMIPATDISSTTLNSQIIDIAPTPTETVTVTPRPTISP